MDVAHTLAPLPDAGVSQFVGVKEWRILFSRMFQLPISNGFHDGRVFQPFLVGHAVWLELHGDVFRRWGMDRAVVGYRRSFRFGRDLPVACMVIPSVNGC